MVKTAGRMQLCILLLTLILAFIWGNSLLPGEISGAISGWVKNLIRMIIHLPESDPEQGHGLLRKLAHFTEFGCLGMVLCWLFCMVGKRALLALICGFSVACTDELIQCFVPDRGPAVKDVLIDTAGVAVGIGLLLAGYAIYQKTKNKKTEEIKQ